MNRHHNAESAIIATMHASAAKSLKPKQLVRWEDDGQGGGEMIRFTPGKTLCWSCRKTIDKHGDCKEGCGGHC